MFILYFIAAWIVTGFVVAAIVYKVISVRKRKKKERIESMELTDRELLEIYLDCEAF